MSARGGLARNVYARSGRRRDRRSLLGWLFLGLAVLLLGVPANRSNADAHAAAPLPVGPTKRIAFSFDDAPRGPGAFLDRDTRAGLLLSGLQAGGVRQAVFFVNPAQVNPAAGDGVRLDAYEAMGHVLADHSFSHPDLSRTSAEAFLADIDRAEHWLRGRPGYRPWFRYPYLDEGGLDHAKRDAVRAGLAARGLRDGYATIDGSDWNLESQAIRARRAGQPVDLPALRSLYVETMVQSADFADDLTRRTIGRSPPHVLLLHETDIGALFIADLARALRADGWTIVTADEAYADPIYRSLPDIRFANGTLPEMLAWEKGVRGPRWYARNDIKTADRLFRERVLHEKAG